MKKTVLIAGLVGFLVALTLGTLGIYLYHQGIYGKEAAAVVIMRKAVLWVWPTAIVLMDAEETLSGLVLFLLSSIANGGIYGAAAFCIASGWKKLFRSRVAAV